MADVSELIAKLSHKHVLKSAPETYVRGFVATVSSLYPASQIEKILKERLFVPDDSNFNLDIYLESVVELSVQNNLKQNSRVKNFEINKRVNPPKDVDVYYEVGATRVSLEVKCPVEIEISSDSYTATTVGRISNHPETFNELKSLFDSPTQSLDLTKNKDNTLKDFLISTHAKVSPNSGVDDLNVLFVACGDCGNIQEWYNYLYGREGFFTDEPILPAAEYELVDVVVLSNLKYCHTHAQKTHDWTLGSVFLLPFVNPHRRASAMSESIIGGLSVFDHHLKGFNRFVPMNAAGQVLKVNHYVAKELKQDERERYFPTLIKK